MLLGACATGAGGAPAMSGADAAAARHAGMVALGQAVGALTAETKKPAPDAAALKTDVDAVVAAGKGLPNWFPKNSGPGQGFATRAKAEIWTDASFQGKVAAFTAALNELDAAKNADPATIAAKAGALGPTCGGCHGAFRGPAAPPPA
jgi:cytochrome c556